MRLLALDVGTKRIGLAFANTKSVRIAVPRGAVLVDGKEFAAIFDIFRRENADALVVGFPRNNAGIPTKQSAFVETFVAQLKQFFAARGIKNLQIFYQDESLTSVEAEQNLLAAKKPQRDAHGFRHPANLVRADRVSGKVDTEAATLILQDFLESSALSLMEETHA